MAPRANWKGYLRLSLVSCPIALYPASSLSEKVSFNRINRKTGNRLKQQNVDSETGEVRKGKDTTPVTGCNGAIANPRLCFSVAEDRARGSRTPGSGRKHLLKFAV